MDLSDLYKRRNTTFDVYVRRLTKLWESRRRKRQVLLERKIVTTVEIIDDDADPATAGPRAAAADQPTIRISEAEKQDFIQKASAIGEYDNPDWVRQIVNGMKQAGVQGFNEFKNDERPVTRAEVQTIIEMLLDLISQKPQQPCQTQITDSSIRRPRKGR